MHFLDHVFADDKVVACRAYGQIKKITDEKVVLTQWWTDGAPDDCECTAIVRAAITAITVLKVD